MTGRGPLRRYADWITDSARWQGYVPRAGDVVVATAPKCGTTWMQRIVGLLVFGDPAPRSVDEDSPWIDRNGADLDEIWAAIGAQQHRRYLKSHLPLDSLPLFDEVFYIHVARDGRDAAMSIHDMVMGTKPGAAQRSDPDQPSPYELVSPDVGTFFRDWLSSGVTAEQDDGSPFVSFFDLENSFWAERARPNLLMVHYNDLKADLDGEMHRIAAFLGIAIDEAVWPALVRAATFEEMRKDGATIKSQVVHGLERGAEGFFNKGSGGRWRDLLGADDLALYEAKVRDRFSPALAAWIEQGRLVAGDPRDAAD